jgi:hypothetical protein
MYQNLLPDNIELEEFIPVIIPYFEVGGSHYFDTESFTSLVKIQPTSTWRQKIPHLINMKGVPQVNWSYRFRYVNAEWIEKASDKVLSLFHPLRAIIKPFVQQHKIHTTVYLRIFTSNCEKPPLMQLTRKTMHHILELGSSFQIDIYSIDKIESYEKLLPVSYKTKKDGSVYWVLREVK